MCVCVYVCWYWGLADGVCVVCTCWLYFDVVDSYVFYDSIVLVF